MTAPDSRVKLDGPHGPIRVSADYPLEAVLKRLRIPYRVISEKEMAENWERYQREHSEDGPLVPAPMNIPSDLLDLLDLWFYGAKKEGP